MYFDYSNARKELEERKKQESREYNFAIFTKSHPITISLFPLRTIFSNFLFKRYTFLTDPRK